MATSATVLTTAPMPGTRLLSWVSSLTDTAVPQPQVDEQGEQDASRQGPKAHVLGTNHEAEGLMDVAGADGCPHGQVGASPQKDGEEGRLFTLGYPVRGSPSVGI